MELGNNKIRMGKRKPDFSNLSRLSAYEFFSGFPKSSSTIVSQSSKSFTGRRDLALGLLIYFVSASSQLLINCCSDFLSWKFHLDHGT